MEAMVKKYQQRFRKVRDEMETWAELQSLLTSQFRNASSIIQRLQVLQDSNNYGEGLRGVAHLQEAVLLKQMESLQKLLLSMNNTLEQFHGIVLSLGRIHRDGRQMIKGGSSQLSFKQLQQRVGVKPSLADCVDGLMLLQDMHCSEYLLKSSLVSALSELTLKPSASDLGSLQQILIDQPNIPKEEEMGTILKAGTARFQKAMRKGVTVGFLYSGTEKVKIPMVLATFVPRSAQDEDEQS